MRSVSVAFPGHIHVFLALVWNNSIIEPRNVFQQCGILTCVDIDKPVHHLFKLRNSK